MVKPTMLNYEQNVGVCLSLARFFTNKQKVHALNMFAEAKQSASGE